MLQSVCDARTDFDLTEVLVIYLIVVKMHVQPKTARFFGASKTPTTKGQADNIAFTIPVVKCPIATSTMKQQSNLFDINLCV